MSATIIDAAARQVAAVIGALLGDNGTATPAPAPVSARWIVRLQLAGPFTGLLHLGMPHADGSALAKAVMALDETPEDASITDTLLEVCGQAIGAVGQDDAYKGLKVAQTAIEPTAPSDAGAGFDVAVGAAFKGAIALWWEPADVKARVETGPRSAPAAEAAAPAVPVLPQNLDVILDIDLPLAVRFGETEMTLASLTRLAPGSVIDLGRSPDDPVDVLVNGRLIARAEVVVVSGNYGVRITEIISPADRLRSVAL